LRVRLTTSPPSHSRLSRLDNVGASTSHNPMGLHGLLRGYLSLFSSLQVSALDRTQFQHMLCCLTTLPCSGSWSPVFPPHRPVLHPRLGQWDLCRRCGWFSSGAFGFPCHFSFHHVPCIHCSSYVPTLYSLDTTNSRYRFTKLHGVTDGPLAASHREVLPLQNCVMGLLCANWKPIENWSCKFKVKLHTWRPIHGGSAGHTRSAVTSYGVQATDCISSQHSNASFCVTLVAQW
jgi:hypothetical protein